MWWSERIPPTDKPDEPDPITNDKSGSTTSKSAGCIDWRPGLDRFPDPPDRMPRDDPPHVANAS